MKKLLTLLALMHKLVQTAQIIQGLLLQQLDITLQQVEIFLQQWGHIQKQVEIFLQRWELYQ